MTRVGVTGHQNLPREAAQAIRDRISAILRDLPAPISGFSSLAEGADQLFARLILEAGGDLHAVIPAADYESTLDGTAIIQYRELLRAAVRVEHLNFTESGEEAYDAAGHYVVDHSDILIAVWDGQPARGLGGTADAVAYAKQLKRRIHVVWPEGIIRD